MHNSVFARRAVPLGGGILLLFIAIMTGCGPSITPQEYQRMETGNTVRVQNTDFQQALRILGEQINTDGEIPSFFMVEPIENKSGQAQAPPEITNMVITSVNQVNGQYLGHVNYSPDLVLPEGSPQFIIRGAISEFDQNISVKESGMDVNLFLSPEIENEIIDIDVNAEFDQAETVSHIVIDFHLLDAQTGLYSEINCSNHILLYDIVKNRQWRFIIFGSGLTRWGKIQVKQGAHEAVRKLVDYSMLQLFGTYYRLPYWKAFGLNEPEYGRELLSIWRRQFLRGKTEPEQYAEIQRLLLKYPLREVYVGGTLRTLYEMYTEEYGDFGEITHAFALKFSHQYASNSPLIRVLEGKDDLYNSFFGDMYIALVQHLPFQ